MKSTNSRFGLSAFAIAALTACTSSEPDPPTGQVESALCNLQQSCPDGSTISCSSSTIDCNAGDGTFITCDGLRVSCPSPTPCTCGAARFTKSVVGRGSGCGVAVSSARSSIVTAMQLQCTSGACNTVETIGECIPVSDMRTDGFTNRVTDTYSCKEPVGCK